MKHSPLQLNYQSIGVFRSPFKEKFGIPRQPMLAKSSPGQIVLFPDPKLVGAVSGLEGFSHLWVFVHFHDLKMREWHPTIRPPRLGGKKKIGVFASRSPHRPNPIGISLVKLERIEYKKHPKAHYIIHVKGGDILDETPVLDIKPYLPIYDSVPEATHGWIETASWDEVPVEFSPQLLNRFHPEEIQQIHEIVAQDPRPTHQRRKFPVKSETMDGLLFGMRWQDFDVRFRIRNKGFYIEDIIPSDRALLDQVKKRKS